MPFLSTLLLMPMMILQKQNRFLEIMSEDFRVLGEYKNALKTMIAAERLKSVQEYYFSKKLREVRTLIAEGKPIINMGIGSPDLSPSPKVLEVLRDALTETGAHQYQSYQGVA